MRCLPCSLALLTQCGHFLLSHASGLRIKEAKEVYEGELVELTPEETENPYGGYGKTVCAFLALASQLPCSLLCFW